MSILLSRQHPLCFKLQCPETGSYCSHKWTRLKCFLTTSDGVLYSWNVIWKKHMKIEKYIQRIDRKYINCIWMKKGKTWFFFTKDFEKGCKPLFQKVLCVLQPVRKKVYFYVALTHPNQWAVTLTIQVNCPMAYTPHTKISDLFRVSVMNSKAGNDIFASRSGHAHFVLFICHLLLFG